MNHVLKNNRIIKNIFYTFGAQGISMILSILMSLFLPKILGVKEYSYWQLFIFYISYAGFFHLGLNDGMYLKQGGIEYECLDYNLLNTNLFLITIFQIIVTIIGCITLSVSGLSDKNRIFVMICSMVYMIIYNYSGYLSYILQIANNIKEYSISVVIEKIVFLVFMIIGIVTGKAIFSLYIILNILAKLFSLIYSAFECKEIVCARLTFTRSVFEDFIDNIRVGINITISSVAGMLVLGIGRNLIDARWGVETFGKFSLAISLSNFMLQFISQVSLVLFPVLKRADENKIVAYYETIKNMLSFFLLGILLGYMPIYYFLQSWLPKYEDSLRYMVVLLPVCIFDGKMSLLCNTYLKVLRKEKQLLLFNIIALFVSSGLCMFSAYILRNVFAVAISMVIAVAIRSIIAEVYLNIQFKKNIIPNSVVECFMCFLFVLSTWFLGAFYGFIIYIIGYLIICVINKKKIYNIVTVIRG